MYDPGQMVEQQAGWLSAAGAAPSNTWRRSTFGWLQKEKNQEPSIEKSRGTVNPADSMTKHLDGKRLVIFCDLLNIKYITG